MGNISKYLLNGHKSTLQALQNLFQSVQLNINNPNFLIMQGKITKVLNMKPAEILGMVEEAAGTRMFEERKDKAVKTMTKKDKKVEELASVGLTEVFVRGLTELGGTAVKGGDRPKVRKAESGETVVPRIPEGYV
jgi:structural maintenance of chromosome 2